MKLSNCIAGLFASSLVAASAVAGPVTLSGGSFESPASGNPDGWGVFSGGSTLDVEDVSTDYALDGTQSLKFSPLVLGQNAELFNPNYTTAGDATTPVSFALSAYKPSSNAITNHFLVLGIEFKKLNVPGDPGSGDTGVYYNEQIFETNTIATDTWSPLSVTFTPTGAWDVLLFHVKLVGLENTSSGALYVDNASANVVVPEPAMLTMLGVGAAGLLLRRKTRAGM